MTAAPSHSVQSEPFGLLGIRIARISTVPFFVVAQLKHQIATLGEQGAQISVVTSNEPELALLEGLNNVRCVPIDIPRSISVLRDVIALFRLYLFFRRERIQIAHSTTPKAGLLTALAAFAAGVPVRLHTFTGQPWVTLHGAKRLLSRASDQLIGRLSTRCYTDSLSQRQFLIAQSVVSAKQLFVIGAGSLAGVDAQRFDSRRFSHSQCESMRLMLGIPIESPVVLFLGRITVDKGVRELLLAFDRLKAVEAKTHLVLVGRLDVESGVAGAISSQDLRNLPDVHVVGYTETPESYLAIADILCLPSYREGFGTVVIEAAAMGVPTVATKIYGLTDAIDDGETGLLVPPQDVNTLSNCLLRLLNDKQLRMTMGAAARRRAIQLFDSRSVNLLLVHEYLRLLRSAGISI